MYTYKLTVYNEYQKGLLFRLYNEWGDISHEPEVIYYNRYKIEYLVSFRFKANMNGFLYLFFANVKSDNKRRREGREPW